MREGAILFKTEYFDMYRMGMFKGNHANAKYIPKRSAKIKNKIRNAKRNGGKKK